MKRAVKEDSSLFKDWRTAAVHLDANPKERTFGNSLKDQLDAELKDLAGDCIEVVRLLKEDSSLLKDRALGVLHLGVSRGCVEIVEQVVKFYDGEDILGDKSEEDKQGVQSSAEEEIHDASSGNKDAPTVAPDEGRTKADNKSVNSGADPSHSADDAMRIEVDKGTTSRFLTLKSDLAKLDTEADEIQARPVVDFDELLHAKYLYSGPDREFNALGVAVVNGNLDVLALLLTKTPSASRIGPETQSASLIELHRDQLRKITERVVESIKGDSVSFRICRSIFNAWRNDREFNFLFWDFDLGKERVSEYLLHFLLTKQFRGSSRRKAMYILEYLWKEVRDYEGPPGEQPLWQSLLKLHDAQGRTPLQVAIEEGSIHDFANMFYGRCYNGNVQRLLKLSDTFDARDGLGRTALHRAVVLGYQGRSFTDYSELDPFSLEIDKFCKQPMEDPSANKEWPQIYGFHLDYMNLAFENGFKGYRKFHSTTALQSAIMHRSAGIVYGSSVFSPQDNLFECSIECKKSEILSVDALELATLTGDEVAVKLILDSAEQGRSKAADKSWRGSGYGWLGREKPGYQGHQFGLYWPTIHIAASSGMILRAFIESKLCDPYIEDTRKRTDAVLDPQDLRISGHLFDFVNVKYIGSNYLGPPPYESTIAERQRCINLLLQSGCDIFKVDENGQAPYPRGSLTTDKDFLSWWYDNQSKEFNASRNAMNFAANAISVMATLVATASCVGLLQPPLGYSSGDGPNQIQAKYIWVRIFIVCNTLSFYLAIAAIAFSLIPALPMPQQKMAVELERTRGMIILAVATLYPSIVCIFVAFASEYIVLMSANGISSVGGNLTMITASIGGGICLTGFFLLFIRLLENIFLRITFPRTRWVRKIYVLTSFFQLRGTTFATPSWARIKSVVIETWRECLLDLGHRDIQGRRARLNHRTFCSVLRHYFYYE